MKKPNKSSKILQRKRAKRALAEARRKPNVKKALAARRVKLAAERTAALEALRQKMIEEWKKQFGE